MGNLYGSEYWSYLLPRYTGAEHAGRINRVRLPMGVREALSLGLIDRGVPGAAGDFVHWVRKRAEAMTAGPGFDDRLVIKKQRRETDESVKPLQAYRDEELEKMRLNFYGFDPSYHVARYNFVYKVPKSRTPLTIARHRQTTRHSQRASGNPGPSC
jgi:putative two-component system hydrogenase maturation factor HypX/HoxX